jgi:hypothetical protein
MSSTQNWFASLNADMRQVAENTHVFLTGGDSSPPFTGFKKPHPPSSVVNGTGTKKRKREAPVEAATTAPNPQTQLLDRTQLLYMNRLLKEMPEKLTSTTQLPNGHTVGEFLLQRWIKQKKK